MDAQDSYDALAASIERALRSDLEPPGSATHLVGSIDRIMLDESRSGELRLAYLRLLVVAPYTILALRALVRTSGPATMMLVAPVVLCVWWLASSVAFVLALRRGWYRRWLPHVSPVMSAAVMLATFIPLWRVAGPAWLDAPEALGCLTALCAFLSLAGALRLSRWSARAGAILGVVVFVIAAASMGVVDLLGGIAITCVLLATGLLSTMMTKVIRRVVTDEVARVTLSRMYEEAEATIDAREQVLKIVSHDLRNPLHTIAMSASLLLDVPIPPEQQPGHLQRIKRAGERMNRLIQDLMDVAKLEAGRIAIDARPTEVAPLLREAHELLSPLADEKEIRLQVIADESVPNVMADAGRVLQVLSNLVGNALKFTPKGGGVVIRTEPAPGGVRFSVTDTGQGIPPEQMTKIFGRFWQANPADRRGIGLGLTIAKGIVEAHGGRIWCESRLGEGTTFHFTLATTLPPTASGARERRREEVASGETQGGGATASALTMQQP